MYVVVPEVKTTPFRPPAVANTSKTVPFNKVLQFTVCLIGLYVVFAVVFYYYIVDNSPSTRIVYTYSPQQTSNTSGISEINAELGRRLSFPVWNIAKEKVAVIVPYRKRRDDLLIFLTRIIPFLNQQKKEYAIVITEQANSEAFNRAKLFNVAVKEIRQASPGDRLRDIQCFILHDVDKLPISSSALYECGQSVRQLATSFRSENKTLRLYDDFLGAVTAFRWEHIERINGASNIFYGWGGEDDDLAARLRLNKIPVDRASDNDGIFDEFDANHPRDMNEMRIELTTEESVARRWKTDGLNQTSYHLHDRINYDFFVWLLASV
ncbi:unnamed protein product [Dibothriocephalus latus]|uniref:Beta-1,4-galactosyltransferase n=1 Tax=Dibothriocephalus latus TaxID=60516 RepID=A0A3P7LGZ9_DIBLA|nr:unnamed protein product [Dibothriocephalus latus]